MQPIILAGYPLGSSLGLVAAMEWIGQPYRASRVAMPDDMATPEFARVNGRRETPALITENGEVLTETMAIALWLEARDSERRISFEPGSTRAALMHQTMAFVNSSFTPAFSPLWAALEMPDISDDYRETLRDFGRRQVSKRLSQIEDMLEGQPFLTGERPTLADALFIGVARWADFHEVGQAGRYPRIDTLKSRLEDDPAVAFAHRLEDGTVTSGPALTEVMSLQDALACAKVPA